MKKRGRTGERDNNFAKCTASSGAKKGIGEGERVLFGEFVKRSLNRETSIGAEDL